MFRRFQKRLSIGAFVPLPGLTLGGAFLWFMIFLYLTVALAPAFLVTFGGYSMAAAIQTTVLLVGCAYAVGMAIVFRYF